MVGRVSRIVSVCVAVALLLTGCGDDHAGAASRREITVFAASSLTAAFTDVAEQFEASHDGVKIAFNFAASSALLQQTREGARPDVVAFADAATMKLLRADYATDAPTVFARNRLVVVTPRGNPDRIDGLADLAGVDVVALCAAQVPCGQYAAVALAKAGVALSESRITRGQNAAATLSAVADGDAGAGVVYATDARAAAARVTAVEVSPAHNVVAAYPIAMARDGGSTARAFVRYVLSSTGQRVLRAHGFLRP